MGLVTIPGVILLVAYLALYFGVWGWAANRLIAMRDLQFAVGLGLPAAWVLLEYLRSILLTGLGWNLLAHTQWHWIRLIQLADLAGVYGVSFLVVMVNVALYLAVKGRGSRVKVLGIAGICLLIALAYGYFRLQQFPSPSAVHPSPSFQVAVVQGNIPQTLKWEESMAPGIWKQYEALNAQAAAAKPDLIVWPETAVPGYLEDIQVQERLERIARSCRTNLLVGVPAGSDDGARVFNSAIWMTAEGKLLQRYDKVHLVPFGEYVPLGSALTWLRNFVLMGDFSAGREFTVFNGKRYTVNGTPPFSVLICFEDLFPGLTRRFVQEGARWLLVITNDAWFGHSAASLQHLQASVFRAVENRVWVVRAANTGWSGFVDPAGRRLPVPQQVPRFEPGVAAAGIWVVKAPRLYSQWGDGFVLLCLGVAGWAFRRRKSVL